MSTPAAKYPASVWDRSSLARAADPTIDREPSFKDWDQAVDEIIAMQQSIVGGVDETIGLNTKGLVELNYVVPVPNTAANYDIVPVNKIAVVSATVIKAAGSTTGGASDAITVKNGTTAITDAMSLNTVAAKSVVRNAQIDLANNVIAAGGTLRVTAAKTTDCSCTVFIKALVSL